MAWRDNLQDASLNGVQFFYENVQTQGGRKVAEFDFPGRDENYIEDLGLKPKRFSVRAYLIGDDYDVSRDNLIDVLDSNADLAFQHPYQGEFTVRLVGGYSFTEDAQQGGIAMFDFVLVESGDSFPIISEPSDLEISSQAEIIQQSLAENTAFDVFDAIGDVFDAVRDGIVEVTSLIRKQNGRINAITGAASQVDSAIDRFEGQISTLMGQPQNLMNQFIGLISSVNSVINNFVPDNDDQEETLKKASLNAIDEVMDFEIQSQATFIPTNQNALEVNARESVQFTTKAAYLSGVCVNLTNLEIRSSDEALGLLSTIDDYFDSLFSLGQANAIFFEDLETLRAAMGDYLVNLAKNTPSIQEYTPPYTTVALPLAYEIYGDATRDTELLRENGIINPTVIPGGEVIRYIP